MITKEYLSSSCGTSEVCSPNIGDPLTKENLERNLKILKCLEKIKTSRSGKALSRTFFRLAVALYPDRTATIEGVSLTAIECGVMSFCPFESLFHILYRK